MTNSKRPATPSPANTQVDGSRFVSEQRLRQRGATALEFALIFPLLFALLYGVIAFSYAFVLQQSLTYAAQQSAAVAVNVSPVAAGDGYEGEVRTRVRAGVEQSLNWLPASQLALVLDNWSDDSVSFPSTAAGELVRVDLQLTLSGLFPVMDLPLFGNFPPLPESLIASASVLIGE